eukprot:gene8839-1584_t
MASAPGFLLGGDDALSSLRGVKAAPLKTGLALVDERVAPGGLRPGDVLEVVGMHGSGKTEWAASVAAQCVLPAAAAGACKPLHGPARHTACGMRCHSAFEGLPASGRLLTSHYPQNPARCRLPRAMYFDLDGKFSATRFRQALSARMAQARAGASAPDAVDGEIDASLARLEVFRPPDATAFCATLIQLTEQLAADPS